MIDETVTRRIVTEFLKHVRSGRDLKRTADLMERVVLAHQVQSEDEATIERTPAAQLARCQPMRSASETMIPSGPRM